jgi:hypothetical protein
MAEGYGVGAPVGEPVGPADGDADYLWWWRFALAGTIRGIVV